MYIQASVSGVRKESSTGRQLWLLSSDSTELSSPLREARKAEKTHSWPLFRKSLLIPALGTKDLGGVSFFFFLLFFFLKKIIIILIICRRRLRPNAQVDFPWAGMRGHAGAFK